MKKQKMNNSNGITLIALVISIIVMLILAGVSLNAVVGENGVLTQAQDAVYKSTLASYKEELELNLVEDYEDANNINCVGEAMKQYIPSMTDDELDNFVIYKGKLMYIGIDEKRAIAANSIEIESGSEVTKDIVKVTDTLNQICASVTPPADDTQPTPSGCIGTRLYDKNNQNSTNWRLVIEYSNSNEEKARYGSGWFLLKSGTTLSDGTVIKNDYVVNYGTNEMNMLSNYKEWTLRSQLAVTDGIVLNVDAKNLANGSWTGVTKHGQVLYQPDKQSLYFDGDGDYLEITKPGDFSNGFTFEFYGNIDTFRAPGNFSGGDMTGLFFRGTGLDAAYTSILRFGIESDGKPCSRFGIINASTLEGENFFMRNDGYIDHLSSCPKIFQVNKDFYLTVTYMKKSQASEAEKNALNWTDTNDRIIFYNNGQKVGYAPINPSLYTYGLSQWNKDSCHFFVGTSIWNNTGQVYYTKGNIYSTRLYNAPLSMEEVEANCDSTMQFRSSGL